MPAPSYSTDPGARFRVVAEGGALAWPQHATVTARWVADHKGDLAALVASGVLVPVGPEHEAAPTTNPPAAANPQG